MKATDLDGNSAELWFNKALCGFSLQLNENARSALEQCLALNPGLVDALMLRCAWGVLANEKDKDDLLSEFQQKYPERYRAWTEEYRKTNTVLSYFTPLEMPEDPFIHTFIPPPGLLEPVGLLHLLRPF